MLQVTNTSDSPSSHTLYGLDPFHENAASTDALCNMKHAAELVKPGIIGGITSKTLKPGAKVPADVVCTMFMMQGIVHHP